MSRSIVCATILLTACVGWTMGIGCGESIPADSASNPCSDWQCTRNLSNYCVRGYPMGWNCTSDHDCYQNLQCTFVNASGTCTTADSLTKNVGIGLVGAMLGVLCFGSTFVPIKKYKKFAGDGIFAQFLMNFGRFTVGLIILFTRSNRWFYWEAAMGGAIWSLGNALGVPIVQCIGVGLGVSIWGCTNMLLGWASGHFGLLGVKQEFASKPALEYTSVAFSFVSIILFIFVKPVQMLQHNNQKPEEGEDVEPSSPKVEGERAHLLDDDKSLSTMPGTPSTEKPSSVNNAVESKTTIGATLGAKRARVIGITMALIAGCLFGICMDPAQHLMSRFDTLTAEEDAKYSPFGLDYVFSNNCGALAMSSILLVTHSILSQFKLIPFEKYFDPVQHSKLILPAILAGAIGSCGSAAWFFANQNLGLIVSFPIIAAGPGVVSSLWGAIVFKEIKGIRNFAILGCAFLCVIGAGVCSSLSK
ncbi:sugar transporter, putative [Bodo saltans]|uniref:Sugar transporter, putative n=1 Tax=Bodo saltans TaxID=75058 RepID=A0A0S4JH14_BODSA|nr:sugar transporter, putative [Bodo saltans]|eukprot:CUG90755.1 sugar transporter, putative [Bodo saltans]